MSTLILIDVSTSEVHTFPIDADAYIDAEETVEGFITYANKKWGTDIRLKDCSWAIINDLSIQIHS